jgi:hypothetical protein
VRIDRIATPAIVAFIDRRLKGGIFCGRKLGAASERTANLDLMRLRNVLKTAIDDGYLRRTSSNKMLDEPPPPKRTLVTPTEFDRLIEARAWTALRNEWRSVPVDSNLVFNPGERGLIYNRCRCGGRGGATQSDGGGCVCIESSISFVITIYIFNIIVTHIV